MIDYLNDIYIFMYNKALLSQLSAQQQVKYLKNKRLDYAANANDIKDINRREA